jgi:hypothetical protein
MAYGQEVRRALALALTAGWATGCGGSSADEGPPGATPDAVGIPAPYVSYVAISGGGFRSHTAQAGWTLGMLDAFRVEESDPKKTLADLTTKIDAISSNSGGTWFLSQLAFSEKFANSLEAADAYADYASTTDPETDGYLGQIHDIYDNGRGCSDLDALLRVLCDDVASLKPWLILYSVADGLGLNWVDVVDKLVFAPFDMNVELNDTDINGTRQPWAKHLDLVFASSMLTEAAVLNERGILHAEDKGFYSAFADTADVPTQVTATPVAFSSVSGEADASFFFAAGAMNAEYGDDASDPTEFRDSAVLSTSRTANIPVIQAASASSAAAGALASVGALEQLKLPVPLITNAEVAYEASDLAPAFSVGSDMTYVAAVSGDDDASDFASAELFRLADGAYADNLGVAYLIKHLSDTNQLVDDFNVVAFVNSTGDLAAKTHVTNDVAWLFGVKPEFPDVPADQVRECGDVAKYCVALMSPQVFETAGFATATNVWQYPAKKSETTNLYYVKYSVTIAENETFGITDADVVGTTGFFHVFVSLAADAPDVPTSEATFTAYDNLLTTTYEGVTKGGGWAHLNDALRGVKPVPEGEAD